MTEHLPECYDLWQTPSNCVLCDALRACEDRITAAAVQRVEALWSIDPSWDGTNWNNALHAATDAIKGDQP
jgi:hypothetical protein